MSFLYQKEPVRALFDILQYMAVDVLVFLFGASLGSFFHVVALRWGKRPSWREGRSRCAHCGYNLRWFELIPIASYLFLRGHCQRCGVPIPIRYFAVELIYGSSTLLLFQAMGPSYAALAWFALLLGFLLIALVDYFHFLVPDELTFPFILLGILISAAVYGWQRMLIGIAAGLLLALIFGILYLLSRGTWLGFGDVKLVLLIGIVFGYPVALAVTLSAIWSAVIVGGALIVLHRADMKTALPFGTFLALVSAGTIVFTRML